MSLFLVPSLAGLVLTVLLRTRFRLAAVWAALVGIVLAFGLVLDAYFSASASYQCYDCENYLGRWWEPQLVGYIVGFGYVAWLMGVGVGAALAAIARGLVALRHERRETRGAA